MLLLWARPLLRHPGRGQGPVHAGGAVPAAAAGGRRPSLGQLLLCAGDARMWCWCVEGGSKCMRSGGRCWAPAGALRLCRAPNRRRLPAWQPPSSPSVFKPGILPHHTPHPHTPPAFTGRQPLLRAVPLAGGAPRAPHHAAGQLWQPRVPEGCGGDPGCAGGGQVHHAAGGHGAVSRGAGWRGTRGTAPGGANSAITVQECACAAHECMWRGRGLQVMPTASAVS